MSYMYESRHLHVHKEYVCLVYACVVHNHMLCTVLKNRRLELSDDGGGRKED